MRASGCLDRCFIVAVVPWSHTQDTTYEEFYYQGEKSCQRSQPSGKLPPESVFVLTSLS